MPYTEYCAKTGGSKLNAGTLNGSSTEPPNTPFASYSSGSWANPTFTVSSGNPVADGVTVGMFAALNSGGPEALYIARITAVTATTISLDSNGWGAIPGAGTYNLRVGGAWPPPSGSDWWPFTLATGSNGAKNAAGMPVRVNIKSPGSPINITGGATVSNNGNNVTYQGYGSTYGDGTKVHFLGPDTGASFTMLNFTAANRIFVDLHWDRNGDSGTSDLIVFSNANAIYRCRFSRSRRRGLSNINSTIAIECMFDQNNLSNSADAAGFHNSGTHAFLLRCVGVNNPGSNTDGFGGSSYYAVNCIAANNGRRGFNTSNGVLVNCCAFSNGGSGVWYNDRIYVENTNILKNGGFGFQANNPSSVFPVIRKVGYGTGNMANTSGAVDSGHINAANETDAFFYPPGVAPWHNVAADDYRIIHELATNTGRGLFHPDFASVNIGYPDVGAVARQNVDPKWLGISGNTWHGDWSAGSIINFKFTTRSSLTGATLSIYRDNSLVETTTGVTLTTDFNGYVGLNHVRIDTSADPTFYLANNDYQCVLTAGVVGGGQSVVGEIVGYFRLRPSLTPEGIADTLIGRNIAGGSSGGRTVRQALAASRNRIALDVPASGQFTVYAEDDMTPLWTGTYTRGANTLGPLTHVDPA